MVVRDRVVPAIAAIGETAMNGGLSRRQFAKLAGIALGMAATAADSENREMKAASDTRAGFPDGFLWGVATSAYQIEGAVDEDGRGRSIWDSFVRTPGKIADHSNADRAADHYHRYKEDVGLIKALGAKAYRFSIAWPRVLPQGNGAPNPKRLDFYDRLPDELSSASVGVFPSITVGRASLAAAARRCNLRQHVLYSNYL